MNKGWHSFCFKKKKLTPAHCSPPPATAAGFISQQSKLEKLSGAASEGRCSRTGFLSASVSHVANKRQLYFKRQRKGGSNPHPSNCGSLRKFHLKERLISGSWAEQAGDKPPPLPQRREPWLERPPPRGPRERTTDSGLAGTSKPDPARGPPVPPRLSPAPPSRLAPPTSSGPPSSPESPPPAPPPPEPPPALTDTALSPCCSDATIRISRKSMSARGWPRSAAPGSDGPAARRAPDLPAEEASLQLQLRPAPPPDHFRPLHTDGCAEPTSYMTSYTPAPSYVTSWPTSHFPPLPGTRVINNT